MILKRSIAYTSGWFQTILVSVIVSTIVVFLLVFLQPFGTYSKEINYKYIKLIGYGLCIIVPILSVHVFEEMWFKYNKKKWFLYQELVVLFIGFLFISTVSYIYNTIVINGFEIKPNYILHWAIQFGLPFVPVIIPIWAYLRFRFSEVTIKPTIAQNKVEIVVKGDYQNEEVRILEKEFIMARAQANYVDVFYLKDGQLQKQIIRSTLSKIINEIPVAQQIHRSYLVNPTHIEKISGNTRKGSIVLTYIIDEVPISPKHFLGVKKYLQNRP